MFVLIAGVACATSGPLARYGRPAHPLMIAFGRVAVAGLILCAADLPGLIASIRALTARQRLQIAGVGALLAAHFGLFLWGLDRTSLPAAVALVSLEPLSVVLTAWAIHGIRPKRLEQLGVLAATGGAVLVASGAGAGEHRLDGDLLVIGAVFLYGFYVSAARSLAGALPARRYAALVYSSAAVALAAALLCAPAREGSVVWPIPSHALIAILALALIPTIIGHTAVQTAARRLSPSVVALVCPGETLGGLAIGATMLAAVPTAVELAGAAIILAGSTLTILGARAGAPSAAARPRS